MHSFYGKSCNIHYNSDMSGELTIITKENNKEVKVDTEDILKLVAEFIRSEKISKIESMDWKDLYSV